MVRLRNYVRRIIASEVAENGFLYLSDDLVFVNDSIEPLLDSFFSPSNRSYRIPNIKKTTDRIVALKSLVADVKSNQIDWKDDEDGKKDTIALLEYQIFLDENKYDSRFKKQVRRLILDYISGRYKNYKISREKYIYDPRKVEVNFIDSLTDFITISSNEFKSFENVFFRGHSDLSWKPIPSIYRNSWHLNENRMFREIIIRNSEEFQNTNSTFEKLTIMQHYGLPTRLLDITKNPLVALYFACSDKYEMDTAGEIIVFTPDEKTIRYYDSDTVSMISNLSKAERDLKIKMTKAKFNNSYVAGLKLLHLIKEEKPYFLNEMEPKDFNNALVVRPVNNNARIKKQSGYFFLFGIKDTMENVAEINSVYTKNKLKVRFIIEENKKNQILQSLDVLNINSESLFPEIERGSEYLKTKYQILSD